MRLKLLKRKVIIAGVFTLLLCLAASFPAHVSALTAMSSSPDSPGQEIIKNPGWDASGSDPYSEYISFTVTDYNNDGLQFGALLQGDVDMPADWAEGLGAITIRVGVETNVSVDIQVRGEPFAGEAGNIPVENLKYDDDDNVEGAVALTEIYTTWYTVPTPLDTDHTTQAYYWLTIPPELPDGDYTATIYFKAITP